MKFFQWLKNKVKKLPKKVENDTTRLLKESALAKTMNEIENNVVENSVVADVKKYVHKETGKVYKTERALKAAVTRYNKKLKK